MLKVPFVKYHGAGNDFILIDDRSGNWNDLIHEEWVAKVCHRRFGIGADGLILLQKGNGSSDFFMKYYNSDGRTSTFCGNGGRCVVSFANAIGISKDNFNFLGTDGMHHAHINDDASVSLGMIDVTEIENLDAKTYKLYTGSPHYVTVVEQVEQIDVKQQGSTIRNSPLFVKEGINVNFIQSHGPQEISIRTYERGVEDETLACGTGVVAAAIANAVHHENYSGKCIIHASGGNLEVTFERNGEQTFENIKLIGPAVEVFKGEIEL